MLDGDSLSPPEEAAAAAAVSPADEAKVAEVAVVKVGLNDAASATVKTFVDWNSKMTQASTTSREGGEKDDDEDEGKEKLAAALEGRDDDQHE